MATKGEDEVEVLRRRSIESRRNLAGLRESGVNPLPLIFPEGEEDVSLIEKAFGDSVDIRLLDGGKQKCVELAELLDQDGFTRSRVLVDRDFGAVDGSISTVSKLIIETRAHDTLMDVLLVAPRILSSIVQRVNRDRYRGMSYNDKKLFTQNLLQATMSVAFYLSSIRILNARKDIGLKFDNFPFPVYLGQDEAGLDGAVYWVLTKTKSRAGLAIDIESTTVRTMEECIDVLAEASEIHQELSGREWELIGDHDLLAILDFYLDDNWGQRKLRTLFEAEIHADEISDSAWGREIANFVGSVSRSSSDCDATN